MNNTKKSTGIALKFSQCAISYILTYGTLCQCYIYMDAYERDTHLFSPHVTHNAKCFGVKYRYNIFNIVKVVNENPCSTWSGTVFILTL